jgi:hypothetical protein
MQISGHSTKAMDEKYDQISDADIIAASNAVNASLPTVKIQRALPAGR